MSAVATLLPWVISVLGGVVFWICAKHPWGWAVAVLQQCLYIPLVILTGEIGFLAHTLIYSAVFIRNYVVEIRERNLPDEHKQLCKECRKPVRKMAAV